MRRNTTVIISFIFSGLLACTTGDGDTMQSDADASQGDADASDGTPDTEAPGDDVDADAVAAAAARYADDLVRVTAEAHSSEHALGETVHVWVSPEHADSFRQLNAEDYSVSIDPPPNMLVVKEHFNADGDVSGLTVMFRGPDGYSPSGSDWWWARMDADGTLHENGEVDFCISCHNRAAAADHLFGVPADNQQ